MAVKTQRQIALARMQDGFAEVIKGLHDYYPALLLSDENLTRTPERVAKAMVEMTQGLGVNVREVLKTDFPSEGYEQMVLLRNIEFTSLCAHHFLPFTGVASIGYIPAPGGRVVGISKLARVLDAYAKRPQIQERLSKQIAELLWIELKPEGVAVLIEAKHECIACRGVRKQNSEMVTSAMLGAFRENASTRGEFLRLVRKGG